MKLNFPRTNIEHQLLRLRNKSLDEKSIMKEVASILDQNQMEDNRLINKLNYGEAVNENYFDCDQLEAERIFHLDQIYQICIDYRLRFLDSKLFKGEIPYEAIYQIKTLERTHKTSLKGFKMLAPASLFKLKNADDPLLFAPIGNDYYYLVHKWGNDLHPFRKLIMWPFKTLENFIILLVALSFLCALLVPEGLFSPQQTTTEFFMVFFFIFKWFAGLAIFYGFKMGKNFSTDIWDSRYFNA